MQLHRKLSPDTVRRGANPEALWLASHARCAAIAVSCAEAGQRDRARSWAMNGRRYLQKYFDTVNTNKRLNAEAVAFYDKMKTTLYPSAQ